LRANIVASNLSSEYENRYIQIDQDGEVYYSDVDTDSQTSYAFGNSSVLWGLNYYFKPKK